MPEETTSSTYETGYSEHEVNKGNQSSEKGRGEMGKIARSYVPPHMRRQMEQQVRAGAVPAERPRATTWERHTGLVVLRQPQAFFEAALVRQKVLERSEGVRLEPANAALAAAPLPQQGAVGVRRPYKVLTLLRGRSGWVFGRTRTRTIVVVPGSRRSTTR
ncbi:hypothetical protein F1559_001623 [Cyanidiococcus yangmingshanensis]|uniref:Uncharacterized protein n=1 Tax=Cyanidiococcus yangmingshanensis TaxID=2690220 RepID=A0A7J7IQ61_9RHOD|nr:hypothetical protein F1559_001623 [Cyanidiococcus yangmingshanensis]